MSFDDVTAKLVGPDKPTPRKVSSLDDSPEAVELRKREAAERAKAQGNGHDLEPHPAWPQPREIKVDLPPAPAFDGQALLPDILAAFVLDEADRMPCPPDYIAAALMVALGSVIGARCAIKPKHNDDWIVTPNLYGGGVGDPSTKKTPAFGVVLRFIDRLDAREAETLAEKMKIHEAEMAAFNARQSAIQAAMKKAAQGKGDGLSMDAAVQQMQDMRPPEAPYQRRYKSNDATIEKLGDLLSHNPPGILLFRDELIGLLSGFDKVGHEGDRSFYLEGFNGTGSFSIDRIARGSLHIPNLCLSVFGGIQPDLAERYLSSVTSSLDNDGLVQRFQMLVFPEPVAWEWRDRTPIKGAREAVRDLFDRLASFDPLLDGAAPSNDFVKLPHFSFDNEAQEIFVGWCNELHHIRIAQETNTLLVQHFGKYERLFCAVALILHLAEGGIGNVGKITALRAATWCEYLAGHARRVYGLVEAAKVTNAKLIGRRLVDGKLPDDGFTARDVWKKGWTGISSSGRAELALSILEEHSWVVSSEIDDQAGRPTRRYYTNPRIRRMVAP